MIAKVYAHWCNGCQEKVENVKNGAICHVTRQNQYNPDKATIMYYFIYSTILLLKRHVSESLTRVAYVFCLALKVYSRNKNVKM